MSSPHRIYPSGSLRTLFSAIRPCPSSNTHPVGSSHAPPLNHTLEGHRRLENRPLEPVGTITAIESSGLSPFGESSGDSKEDLKEQARDMEGRYRIQQTFEMTSVVERLRHDQDWLSWWPARSGKGCWQFEFTGGSKISSYCAFMLGWLVCGLVLVLFYLFVSSGWQPIRDKRLIEGQVTVTVRSFHPATVVCYNKCNADCRALLIYHFISAFAELSKQIRVPKWWETINSRSKMDIR